MELMKMRYKTFEFEVNPKDISVSMSKNISKNSLPYSSQLCNEVGKNSTIISGKGYFVGADALEKVFSLVRVYNKKGSDFLFIPSSTPIKTYFSKLDINYSSGNNRVEYTFEFVEDSQNKSDTKDFGYTYAKNGENLFDVANRTGIAIESIVSLNDIGDVFTVREGDKIWLI